MKHAPPPLPPSLWQWLDFLYVALLRVAVIATVTELVIQGPSFVLAHLASSLAPRY